MEKCISLIFSISVMFIALAATIPAFGCTGLLLHSKDGTNVHGRTLEFGFYIESSVLAVPRGYEFVGTIPEGKGKRYQAKYGAVGLMAFENPVLMDGMNEKGLAAGAFYFPTFATYTEVTSENRDKAVSPEDFVNWILTQFATIEEVRVAVGNGEVVIAPTVSKDWGSDPLPLHYIVYDKSGKSLVIEPIDGKLEVSDNPLGVFTNAPNFQWHMTNMRNYITLKPRNAPPAVIDGTTFKQTGQGSGMLGLPGDFTPTSRFVRATIFGATAIPSANSQEGVLQLFHILNNFDIPIGVAREEVDGKVYTDYTMLTMVTDPQTLRYYFKSYDDQTIRLVDLNQLDLSSKELKRFSTKSEQPIVDVTPKLTGK